MTIWVWRPNKDEPLLQQRADKCLFLALIQKLGSWQLSENQKSVPALSRSYIQKLIEEKKITQNSKFISSSEFILHGSMIQIKLDEPESLDLVPEDRELDILFEDEHIAVINKPPGLTVHPSETQKTGTLVHALLSKLKNLGGIAGKLRPGIVHRLDKNTSGAMVISKTDLAHTTLVDTFKKHEIERRYWAICYGDFSKRTQSPILSKNLNKEFPFLISSLIGRSQKDRKKMSTDVQNGRDAKTLLRELHAFGNSKQIFATLFEAKLLTGRTHQVRVHLNTLGFSLLGDPTYGLPTKTNSKWKALPNEIQKLVTHLPGQALHARVLGFKHPVTKQDLFFEATPPPDFQNLFSQLEKYKF